jgi:rare lipoprotein A
MVMSNLQNQHYAPQKKSRNKILCMPISHYLLAIMAVLVVSGCSSTGGNSSSSRYAMSQDVAPDDGRELDPDNIPDAVPIFEPRMSAGNKSPYTVLGETYEVMPESTGYTVVGKASWYGKKFHGYKTSNGETYDMYKMSAAHRTLPIPSYVRVTNLANGRTGIVRVNDRGPFHSDRVMDLSYAAATKLDMIRSGTAQIKIEAIQPSTNAYASNEAAKDSLPRNSNDKKKAAPSSVAAPSAVDIPQKKPVVDGSTYLQAGAFRNQDSAMALREKLVDLTGRPVNVDSLQGFFKVRIGPLADPNEVQNISELLVQNNFAKPQLVYF